VIVGTRASPLARAQTTCVVDALVSAHSGLTCEVIAIVTEGDRTQATGEPLPAIGGKGLFTLELERALREGEIDVAVHSLKDLPTELATDLRMGAVCLREDARDCLVSRAGLTLAALSEGAVVGTSSLRREAQLRALRPDLEIRSIRGNVDTRIGKVRAGEYDAAVLAAAGIRRLGLDSEVADWLSPEVILPAPGQGALAVQCRAGDERVAEVLAAIDDPGARATTSAERTFLRALGGGCAAPVAAHARVVETDAGSIRSEPLQGSIEVCMEALVAAVDGSEVVRVSGDGKPGELGERLAGEAIAAGADRIVVGARV
jgi:hydroxymethylbilane synthase